jgi:flagellar hook-associated protein 2
MASIQSSTGLITGIPIQDTVDQLMALAAKPRDLLKTRIEAMQTEQAAVTELTALLASVQYVARNLGKEKVFSARAASSSDSTALAAVVTGNPAIGTHQFTPLRVVQNQQWLSGGVRAKQDPIGAGSLSFRFGAHVERATPLELLNAGQGVPRGKIRITDRSGASAEIDLGTVQSFDEILERINSNSTIRVTAVAQGDAIRLIDRTGQTAANLQVEEVGGGTTAAALGLDGINVAAGVADGRDLVGLYSSLRLDALNDGNGVVFHTSLADIRFTLRDGTTGTIDLSPIVPGSSQVDKEITLGQVLERINAAAPDKLKAEIGPDGDRLVIRDLTTGDGTFGLESLYGSSALADLGLDGAPVQGTITGRRLLSGLQGVLLSSLGGGKGLGALGTIELTDRGGATATVDLAGAETLADVIDRINAAGLGITAKVNRARNGLEIRDTTGQSGNLVVASADGTAQRLGIEVDAAVDSVQSGDLHLQVVAHNTLLEDYNGRGGVSRGGFTIVDSTGRRAFIDLSDSRVRTIGDVIRKINQAALAVRADINDTGDGLVLRDTGGGAGKLAVIEGPGTTAADLHLLGVATTSQADGVTTQSIDGSTTYTVTWDDRASLGDVAGLIEGLRAGVSAKVLSDGSSQPYHLALISQRAGKAGALVLDTSQATLAFDQTVRPQDALLLLGGADDPAAGMLVSGPSNTFTGLVDGLKLEIKQATGRPVTVTVTQSDADLTASVKTMVDNYNKFRKRLGELTAYDPTTNKRSTLTGDATALRLDNDLSYFLSGRISGGRIQSLGELGITFKQDGSLALDDAKLKARFAEDPEAVRQFFATANTGFSARLDRLLEQAAGQDGSLLAARVKALQDKIAGQQTRLESMNKRLETERYRLLLEFYRMETAIGKLQNNLNAISSIKVFEPVTSWKKS